MLEGLRSYTIVPSTRTAAEVSYPHATDTKVPRATLGLSETQPGKSKPLNPQHSIAPAAACMTHTVGANEIKRPTYHQARDKDSTGDAAGVGAPAGQRAERAARGKQHAAALHVKAPAWHCTRQPNETSASQPVGQSDGSTPADRHSNRHAHTRSRASGHAAVLAFSPGVGTAHSAGEEISCTHIHSTQHARSAWFAPQRRTRTDANRRRVQIGGRGSHIPACA
jgi:hypothetical protein